MTPRQSKSTPHPAAGDDKVTTYKHPAKRKNIPPSGLESQGKTLRESPPKVKYAYNPHLPPVLRFSDDPAKADQLPELLQIARQRALTPDEAKVLADALHNHEPWLEWSGKREKPWFETDPVALHMHERVSTQAILRVLAREDIQRSLFADPQQEYAQAVQFYKHNVDWSNRMILGDSLQVMASLARREDLAGKVQMIYIDPPYGIRFGSNFQPQLGQRDVKDRDQDLTREPEMVKAYRDTWTLGVHSYLAYLRDRLTMARELLADTGSIFVQIGEENRHHVRMILQEVFNAQNFVAEFTYRTSIGLGGEFIDPVCNYLIWYAKNKDEAVKKYRQIFTELKLGADGATRYTKLESTKDGTVRVMSEEEANDPSSISSNWQPFTDQGLTSRSGSETTGFPVNLHGKDYIPTAGGWRTGKEGMQRIKCAERVIPAGATIRFKKRFSDFGALALTNFWDDVAGGIQSRDDPKIFVVQTATKIIERCMLMTTDPGDLVLDPTCGSGTTAYVAEQWGRRWITIDTSRVALALARQRLMTSRFPLYRLRPLNADDVSRNPNGSWLTDPTGESAGKTTLKCKTVPHITLKSIARNTALDPIFARHESILTQKLKALNAALKPVTPVIRTTLRAKLEVKQKREGKSAITDADRRRLELPKATWQEWEAPFDTDPDWPQALQQALTDYRAAWRAKMDEVNACIAASADSEELVDKPEEVRGVVRVTGPFSMESVIALEEGPDTPSPIVGEGWGEGFDGDEGPDTPSPIVGEGWGEGFDGDVAVHNAEAHLEKVLRLLRASGVDFRDNRHVSFSRLEPVSGASLLHADGAWAGTVDGNERKVAVSIGPEVGNMSAYQVEQAIRSANRRGYDDLVLAAFGFDASAQSAIEDDPNPDLRCHMALIRPDVAMDDLLKTQPGSQIFTVFSAPRAQLTGPNSDGEYHVEVEGMDVYDPVTNTLHPTSKDRIAAWFLDSDYDGRTFCITQAFFPDKTKWQKLAKALGNLGVVDEGAFDALSGTTSLPFVKPENKKPGEPWRVAVKVIDPRGNEGMRVLTPQGY